MGRNDLIGNLGKAIFLFCAKLDKKGVPRDLYLGGTFVSHGDPLTQHLATSFYGVSETPIELSILRGNVVSSPREGYPGQFIYSIRDVAAAKAAAKAAKAGANRKHNRKPNPTEVVKDDA